MTLPGVVRWGENLTSLRKKKPEHQQAELDLSLVLMSVQGLK